MKSYLIIAAYVLLTSCGGSKKERVSVLADKKVELEKLKSKKTDIDADIKKMQDEISKLDNGASAQKPKLVSTQVLQPVEFSHYIELQGKIDAENISYITPRGGPGQIKSIYVRQGQHVNKGQLLMKLDNAVQTQNLAAARQGLQTIKTQIAFAKNVYERQKNLWNQNIGTEVQLISAKNNVDALQNQLSAAQANVRTVAEQANSANVYSDVSGVADIVSVRVGEIFTGSPQSGGVIKIVNTSKLKATSNIPENYLTSIKQGTEVIVSVPDINRNFMTAVSFIGSSIDPLSRGFSMEARLPFDPLLKPNQIAMVKIKDYASAAALTIPVNTLQNDEAGKFVMLAVNEGGKIHARKRIINTGFLNGNLLEVKTGLAAGDIIITEGFQNLYDGQLITTQ